MLISTQDEIKLTPETGGNKGVEVEQIFVAGRPNISNQRRGLTVSAFFKNPGRWKFLSRRKFELQHHAAVTLNGKLYITGGTYCRIDKPPATQEVTNKVHSYDIAKRKWKSTRPMLESRHFHSAVTYRGAILVLGGKDSQGQ